MMRTLDCTLLSLLLISSIKNTDGKALVEHGTSVTMEVISESQRGGQNEQMETGSSMHGVADKLEVKVTFGDRPLLLHLTRNTHVNVNAPVTFENIETAVPSTNIENVHFYRDIKNMASVSITRLGSGRDPSFSMEGSLTFDDVVYEIQPDTSADQTNGLPAHIVKERENQDEGTPASSFVEYDDVLGNMDAYDENSEEKDFTPNPETTTFNAYNIEILFVLDHTVWQHWLNVSDGDRGTALEYIKLYYSHQINGMDMIYNSLHAIDDKLEIAVWLKGFHIAETVEDSSWTSTSSVPDTENGVYARQVAQKLGTWSIKNGRTWYNLDHTMLWTRYDLSTTITNLIKGYTNLAGMCAPGRSVTVMEDSGMSSFVFAAHLLGHSLGAYHDGKNNDCDVDGPYVMGTTMQDLAFSSCSKLSFSQLLDGQTDGYPRVCLTNRVCDHDTTPVEDVPTGSDVTNPPGLDEQCRMSYGKDSSFCGESKLEICGELFCLRIYNGEEICLGSRPGALEYTLCSADKWCRRTSCVSITQNPATPATSIQYDIEEYGDFLDGSCIATGLSTAPVLPGCTNVPGWSDVIDGVFYSSCLHMILTRPQLCFCETQVKTVCCATCHRYGAVYPSQHVTILNEAGENGCRGGTYKQGGECVLCPAGTYRQQSGGVQITSCTPCPPGHVSEEGSTSCTECLAGEYSPGPGVSQCQKCPPGSYQENPGSTGCNLCKRGEYQDEVGSSSCKLCNIHMTKTGSIDCSGLCPLGEYNRGDDCYPCPPGTYQNVRYSYCRACTPGTYQPHKGSVTCDQCPKGQYQNRRGQDVCINCPSGVTTEGDGSKREKDCTVKIPDCEDLLHEATCTFYRKNKKCNSDKHYSTSGMTWADYLAANCKNTCDFC